MSDEWKDDRVESMFEKRRRESMKEKYCDAHGIWKVKDGIGNFKCPFCEKEEPDHRTREKGGL